MPRSRSLLLLVAATALAACGSAGSHQSPAAQVAPQPRGASTATVTVAAAGDIACPSKDAEFRGGRGIADACQQAATAKLVEGIHPAAVLALGDTQYDSASASEYAASYAGSWGSLLPITHPAIGNHEYLSRDAAGYFGYFGSAAGSLHHSWYSFDLGAWHLVALNSNCQVVGCGKGSTQERWLRRDLARNSHRCTLAYFHHPLYSSGPHGPTGGLRALWNDLYHYRVDVALTGHDHIYERYAPMDADGQVHTTGVREFVIGSGGKEHYAITTVSPHSDAHDDHTFGVLELRLAPTSYDWAFRPIPGGTFHDAGSARCR